MIEEAIAKLTAAVEANTVALNAILASAGTAPAPAAETTESKPAKEKKSKPAAEEKPKLEVVEPEAPEEDAPREKTFTITEALEASKRVLAADRDKNKPLLAAIREKFGVETVKDLTPDQIGPYMAELAKLEA